MQMELHDSVHRFFPGTHPQKLYNVVVVKAFHDLCLTQKVNLYKTWYSGRILQLCFDWLKYLHVCLWNNMTPVATNFEKAIFSTKSKSRSLGHWPWCHEKSHHWWSMHANYEVSISYGSKVIEKVKFDNRQTDRQIDRTKTISMLTSLYTK